MIRAIIVDDEPAVGVIIKHFIAQERLPIEIVAEAVNGKQAIRLIEQELPDLIFLDIQMPIYNGLEVMCRKPGFNYIIITAYESFSYAQQALRLGASDILLKPIDNEQLVEAVSRAIGYSFTHNTLVNQVLAHIHTNFADHIDLGELASSLGVTSSHMARTFKKHLNQGVVSYINQKRIDRAKALLKRKSIVIQDIALQVGYESVNNFYRCFKKYTGMTPMAFRNLSENDPAGMALVDSFLPDKSPL